MERNFKYSYRRRYYEERFNTNFESATILLEKRYSSPINLRLVKVLPNGWIVVGFDVLESIVEFYP